MKVLLDENLPHELRTDLVGHEVYTVQYMGWDGVKNGRLLAEAARAGFDAMVTVDKGIPYEQNLTRLPIAVLVLGAKSNKIGHLLKFVPGILAALNSLTPNAITRIT